MLCQRTTRRLGLSVAAIGDSVQPSTHRSQRKKSSADSRPFARLHHLQQATEFSGV